MINARIDEMKWVRCGKCSHRLFRMDSYKHIDIEIKCHSCKSINVVNDDIPKSKFKRFKGELA